MQEEIKVKNPTCKICKKELKKEDKGNWVHIGGICACLRHYGVKEWYEKEVEKMAI